MGKVFWVTCPRCGFRYYVGRELLDVEGFPTVCPRCHLEYQPRDSASGISETA